MSRLNAASILALLTVVLLAAACTSTTVIGEGRLGTPVENETASDRGDRQLPSADEEDDVDDPTTGSTNSASDASTEAPDEQANSSAADDDIISLGDEDLIEAWSFECTEGSDLACDILFTITERGSTAETLAQTCGGRSDLEVRFCTPDIEPFEDRLWFDADSPGLPDVVEDCQSGDLISCDFLYFRSEVGSTYEEIGNSCGGRVAVAIPDCRSALAE